jgi:hypothetical protein
MTELRARFFDRALDIGDLAEIGANQQRLAVELGGRRSQTLFVRTDQDDFCAFCLEQLRGFQTDARRAAGDERYLVLELHFSFLN